MLRASLKRKGQTTTNARRAMLVTHEVEHLALPLALQGVAQVAQHVQQYLNAQLQISVPRATLATTWTLRTLAPNILAPRAPPVVCARLADLSLSGQA